MNHKQIVVIGDTIIDHSVYGDVIGLSLETPTIKGRYTEEETAFGGAANVVNNLLELGHLVKFITPIAPDDFASTINGWENANLTIHPLKSTGQNFVKSRFWLERGDSQYKALQLNRGTPTVVSEEQTKEILSVIEEVHPDLVMLVDYRAGLFDRQSTSESIIKYCNERGIGVASSSQTSTSSSRYGYFKNSCLICMNHREATQISPTFEPKASELNKLYNILQSKICVTLGKRGAVYFDGEVATHSEAHKVNALDTIGAGDSFFAAICSDINNINLEFGNKWAALSTLKRGTSVPSRGISDNHKTVGP